MFGPDPVVARKVSTLLEDGEISSLSSFMARIEKVNIGGDTYRYHSGAEDDLRGNQEAHVWLSLCEPEQAMMHA